MAEEKKAGPDRLGELAALAQQLVEEIDDLSEGTGGQLVALSKRSRSNRRLILVTLAGFTLDILLTVALGAGGWQLHTSNDRIDALTRRLDIAQTDTRQRVLCPLYQLLRDSKSAAGRAASPDPQAYDHSFAVIESGYKALKCAEFIGTAP